MYVSIDIETTGLDPVWDQVIQIGAVAWTSSMLMECEHFVVTIDPTLYAENCTRHGVYGEPIRGSACALAMNSGILKQIADGKGKSYQEAMIKFKEWLRGLGVRGLSEVKFDAVGVNFGSFDWQFLKRIPGFPAHLFGYRHTDVGSYFADKDGTVSASSFFDLVAEGFEISGKLHEALFDARCTLAILMLAIGSPIVSSTPFRQVARKKVQMNMYHN